MKIRNATFTDYHEVTRMLVEFGNATPTTVHSNADHDPDHVNRTLLNIQKSGYVLVADSGHELAGMLIAQIVPDVWMPHRQTLQEMAWWVKPEYRDTTAGARLFREYCKRAKMLIVNKKIQGYTMTMLANSPAIDLVGRGWTPVETNYIKTGIK
jgi:hypothetical protein